MFSFSLNPSEHPFAIQFWRLEIHEDVPINIAQLEIARALRKLWRHVTWQHDCWPKIVGAADSRRLARVLSTVSNLLFLFLVQKPSSAIAIQPMENHDAAVGVFMMRLPGAEGGFTPIGQIGICCATALGTRGDPVPQSHPFHMAGRTIVKRSSMVRSCCL